MNESDKTSKLYNAYRTTDIRHMRNPVVDDQRAAPDDYLIKAKTKFEKETRSPDDVKSDVFFGNDTKDRNAPHILHDIIAESETLSKPFGIKKALDEVLCIDIKDFYDGMLSKEEEFSGYYLQLVKNHAYLKNRQDIISFICKACYEVDLDEGIAHCSIFYLDKFMALSRFSSSRLRLMIAACLSIAMKYGVTEDLQVSSSQLMKLIGVKGISALNFQNRGEMIALNTLEWKICCLPPITFIDYFLANGVLFVDENHGIKSIGSIEIISRFEEYATFFSQLCLQRQEFCQYRSSLISSAIIRVTRQLLQFIPWRRELETMTGFIERDLIHISGQVLLSYKEEYPDHYHLTMRHPDKDECIEEHEVCVISKRIEELALESL